MSWGTLLPRHICWSYYYDPRCLRGSSSNLAMICVPSVMILAVIIESIPWCHLVVGILLLGLWTRDTLYLLHVDSVDSSFRILVTFAIVLEVRGISFIQIPWTIMAEVCWIKRSQQALYEFSIICYGSASSTFPHGLPGRNMLNSFGMPNHASTTQKIVCSFELFYLVTFWPSSINW